MKTLLSLLGGLAMIAAGVLLLAGADRRQTWCAAAGLCRPPITTAAMVESMRREQQLIVFAARLVVPVTSTQDTGIGSVVLATTRRTAILPGTATYVLDLAAMAPADLDWDPQAGRLAVRRPPVRAAPPTIHWDQAQVYTDKGWQTALTDVLVELEKRNREAAPASFQAHATAPELLRLADEAADAALAAILRMPLHAAGYRDVTVVINRPQAPASTP